MVRKLIYVAAFGASAIAAEAQAPMLPPHPPGTICFTSYGWCWLPRQFPVGSPCYCATPRGPIAGRTT